MWSPNIPNWMESKYGDLRSAIATSNLPIWQIPLGTSVVLVDVTSRSGLALAHGSLGAILSIADLQLSFSTTHFLVSHGPSLVFLNTPEWVRVVSILSLLKTQVFTNALFPTASYPLPPAVNLLAKSSDKLG